MKSSGGSTIGFWITLAVGVLAFWQFQRASQLSSALAAANTQNAQLQGQLAQLQSQVADLQQHIDRASTQLQSTSRDELPVLITLRQARFAAGMVASFTNYSDTPLEVSAIFQSDAAHLQSQRHLVLPPNQAVEFGAAQGWAFQPGQTIILTTPGYRPLQKQVQ